VGGHPAGFWCRGRLVRIALTLDQIRDRELDIERLSVDVKPSDSRAEKYIEQYGDRCWEADILPASIIERDLDLQIESRLSRAAWDRHHHVLAVCAVVAVPRIVCNSPTFPRIPVDLLDGGACRAGDGRQRCGSCPRARRIHGGVIGLFR
jgi:hypothetical protein